MPNINWTWLLVGAVVGVIVWGAVQKRRAAA